MASKSSNRRGFRVFLYCRIIAVLEGLVIGEYFYLFQVGDLAQRSAVCPVEFSNVVAIPLCEQVDDGISSGAVWRKG